MKLDAFINFNGECKEAVEFYAKVFDAKISNMMMFSDAPAAEGYVVNEADKNKVMYAGLVLGDSTIMFSDIPEGAPYIVGTNVALTVSLETKEEVTRIFNLLSEGGQIIMPPTTTFFSECFGMLTDRFGIIWQILVESPHR
jgi:PhnB protein